MWRMADRETWARRVAEWKASGLTSAAFCKDKDFTAGGLRHSAHQLSLGDGPGRRIRLARVVRLAEPKVSLASQERRPALAASAELVVEVGVARVVVRSGFDRGALAAVLRELVAVAGARGMR